MFEEESLFTPIESDRDMFFTTIHRFLESD